MHAAFGSRGKAKDMALFHLHYFENFFGKDELTCLTDSSNNRLAYERAAWEAHLQGRGGWTYRDAQGREHVRASPSPCVLARDPDGEWVHPNIQYMEMIKFVGLHLACTARSLGRKGHPLSWLQTGDRPLMAVPGADVSLSPERVHLITAVLSGYDVMGMAALREHSQRLHDGDDVPCAVDIYTHGDSWRFAGLWRLLNHKCAIHMPSNIYRVSYDEARWPFSGRLPKGMKKASMNKKGGAGVDQMMLASAEPDSFGYRIRSELDFGHSILARGDPLQRSGRGVPARMQLVPRHDRLLRLVREASTSVGPGLPQWIHVYADNAFTSLRTLRALFDMKVFYTGTTKRQVGNYGIPGAIVDAPIRGRGASLGLTDISSSTSQASCWAWHDKGKKPTLALSSFFQHDEMATVRRRVGEARVQIAAPRAIPPCKMPPKKMPHFG